MRGTLVLVANASRARLWHVVSDGISLVEEWEHPEGRVKESELLTDRPGRTFLDGPSPQRSAYERQVNPQTEENRHFARDLAAAVAKRMQNNDGVGLVLCAPPKFLGQLRGELPPPIAGRVVESLDHDYTALPEGKLLAALRALGVKGTHAPA